MDFNSDDEARIKADNEKARKEYEEFAMIFGDTFRTESGRKVMKHLEIVCNVHGSTVKDKINPDSNSVLFEEGKRMIYEYILSYLKVDNERRKRTQR